ncbi:MAG: hypothetical protein LBH26_07230 [Treponema sp.]|nr:hypothetical protein [Treponema sp.]
MKKSRLLLMIRAVPRAVLIIALPALFLAGCAKPPVAEMDAAENAVIRAENDSDAAAFGRTSLSRAREALARMREEAAAKRYEAAKSFAAEAISAADRAISEGRAASARAREEAAALLAAVKDSLEETGQTIGKARELEEAGLDFDEVDEDFDAARRSTDQAEASLAGNRYQDSMEESRTARGILGDITSKIGEAAIAASRKK